MKKNVITMAGVLVLVAAVRLDLSWGQTGFGPGQSMDPVEAIKTARAGKAPAVPGTVVVENDPQAGKPGVPVEWIAIIGGKFMMGSNNEDENPIHEVNIKTFEMSKTAVTVEQYAECVIKGQCSEPRAGDFCNWGKTDRQLHPVNCVGWEQADQYAKFKGVRLPSESEWEYAGTSGGKNQTYPWGNEDATCERAVMYGNGNYGCGGGGTMPVCSMPEGNTAQGLCDMAGNVWQWVQDTYQDSYVGAPTDGSAVEVEGSDRVFRGGSWLSNASYLRSACRSFDVTDSRWSNVGFRLAKNLQRRYR